MALHPPTMALGTTTRTMASNNSDQHVRLLIVRHGEREDDATLDAYWTQQEARWDALRSSKGKAYATMNLNTAVKKKLFKLDPKPAADTLDPLLTPQGHQQAHASCLAIARALPKDSKVAVFSSPLRRAIGTSLMLGTVPWDDSIRWSAPEAAAAAASSNNPNEVPHRRTTIPVTVMNGLGDFASRVYLKGGARLLSQKGLLQCSHTLSDNDGGSESPFCRALASMPSHQGSALQCQTNRVRFWTPEGRPLAGTIDPHTKPYRAETPADKLHEIQKQKAYFAAVAKQEQKDKKKLGLVRRPSPSPPPNPLGAVDEAVRATLARGCDTCLIVAHREGIRDMKLVCNHRFSISLPYCCIGSFGATVTTSGGGNDRVRYNFWSVVPLENFGPTSIPRCLSHTAGLVRVMYTLDNGELRCLCRLDIREWSGSLPPEVWPKMIQRNSPKVADLNNCIEVGVVASESGHNASMLQSFVQRLAHNGRFLHFDSVFRPSDDASPPRTFRFRLSGKRLPGARVRLWYKALS